jgi:hypothetical protein
MGLPEGDSRADPNRHQTGVGVRTTDASNQGRGDPVTERLHAEWAEALQALHRECDVDGCHDERAVLEELGQRMGVEACPLGPVPPAAPWMCARCGGER